MYSNHPRALRYSLLASLVASTVLVSACNSDNDTSSNKNATSKQPKNIILMINDGASWGTWEMGAHWQKGVAAPFQLAGRRARCQASTACPETACIA